MSVAIDLRLNPADDPSTTVKALTYLPAERQYRELSETVYLTLGARRCDFSVQLTTDEARVLANQLLQVADVADAQRAARIEEDERQASFDEIVAEIHDAEDRGGRTGCLYAHPDVHYVPEDQLTAKVRELTAAGVKRFMVLAEPSFEGAAA